jgi:hypothetical protein
MVRQAHHIPENFTNFIKSTSQPNIEPVEMWAGMVRQAHHIPENFTNFIKSTSQPNIEPVEMWDILNFARNFFERN